MPRLTFHLNRTVQHLRRYRHIVGVLMKYGLIEVGEGLGRRLKLRLGSPAVASRVKRSVTGLARPQRLRAALEELGPTFIKLGQLLSTRPDLLGPEYIRELEHLQDQVAPEKFNKIRAEAEEQLGGRLEELFGEFETEPLAAGSIAQVHRAVTREGDRVVVKIRRPGIIQTLKTECEILESLAGLTRAFFAADEAIEPEQVVREFTEAVSKEVDLTNELHNLLRYARHFADDPTVHIPKAYETYCTAGVLTMEYIEGIKPNNLEAIRAAGLDPRLLACRGADFILRQIFEFGFFHSDPHPGNFLVWADNVLVPLDFGQGARLGSADRLLLGDLVLAVVDKDAGRLVRSLQRMGLLDERTDTERLCADVEDLLDTYHGRPLKEIPFNQVMTRTFELIRKHHVRPPTEFTLMLKSLMTVENLATTLDSDFQLIEHLRPYAARVRLERLDPRRIVREAVQSFHDAGELAAHLPEDLNIIIEKFKRGQFQVHVHHEHLDNMVHTLDKSANQISFALIIAGLLVGSSLLVTQTGMVLGLVSVQTLGALGYLVAAFLGAWLMISIIRGKRF